MFKLTLVAALVFAASVQAAECFPPKPDGQQADNAIDHHQVSAASARVCGGEPSAPGDGFTISAFGSTRANCYAAIEDIFFQCAQNKWSGTWSIEGESYQIKYN